LAARLRYRGRIDSTGDAASLVPNVVSRVGRPITGQAGSWLQCWPGGFLRRIHILTAEERANRQLLRTRNQIERIGGKFNTR